MKTQKGNGIHFLEKTSYYENTRKSSVLSNVFWRVMAALIVSLLIVSTYALLFESMHYSYPVTYVVIVTTLLCVVLALISFNRKLFFIIYSLFFVCFSVYTVLQWKMIKLGYDWFLKRFQKFIDAYFNGYFDASPQKESVTNSFYIWCAMFLLLYISLVIFGFYQVLLSVIPAIASVICSFCVGYVPHFVWVTIVCIVSLLLHCLFYGMKRYGKVTVFDARGHCLYIRKSSVIMQRIGIRQLLVVFIMLFCIIGITYIVKYTKFIPTEESLDVQHKNLQKLLDGELDYFESLGRKLTSSGGISKGDLASAGNLHFNGEEQLIVRTSDSFGSPLYIKGYVGDVYENNRWTASKSKEYSPLNDDKELLNLSYHNLKSDDTANIEIEKIQKFDNIDFIIYGAHSNGQKWLDDLYINQNSKTNEYKFKVSFYTLAQDYKSLMNLGQNNADILKSAGIDGEVLAEYEDYVYQRFTSIPKDCEDYLNSLYSVMPQTLSEKIVWVRHFLNERCTYSLTPGGTPDGKDCVRYFLEENKVGYCMHFASASVLLLRSMGVPSRYVEGYIVMPGSFRDTQSNKTAYVYDHQAHAWAEIYIDGFGWVPVEMTPTYYDAYALKDSEITESLKEEETVQETTPETVEETVQDNTQKPVQETLSESSGAKDDLEDNKNMSSDKSASLDIKEQSKTQNKIMMKVVRVILIILGVGAVMIGQYYVRWFNKMRKLHISRQERALIFAYSELIGLMKACGCVMAKSASIRDIENAHQYFSFLDHNQLQLFASLCNRAAFGPGNMTKDSITTGIRTYYKIRGEILKHLPRWKKYAVVLIYVI